MAWIGVAAFFAGAGVWLVVRGRALPSTPPHADESQTGSATLSPDGPPPEVSILAELRDPPSARDRESASESISTRGIVAFADPARGPTSDVDGALSLRILEGATGTVHDVPVTSGDWRVDGIAADAVHVLSASIDGRRAWPVSSIASRVGDGRFRVILDPEAVGLLRVLGELGDVDEFELRFTTIPSLGTGGQWVRPAEGVEIDESFRLRSPARIDEEHAGRWAWVGAAGHTWARIRLPGPQHPERTVRLDPAGALDVELRSATRDGSLVVELRLYSSLGSVVHFRESTAGTTESITGLPAAEYIVTVNLSGGPAGPVRLARADVRVTAGDRERVVFDLEDPESAVHRHPVRGTLSISPRWTGPGDDRPRIGIEVADRTRENGRWVPRTVGALRLVAPSAELYEWGPVHLPAGEYLLRVDPTRYTERIVVTPSGPNEFALQPPDPALVVLSVVDARDGSEVDVELLAWMSWSEGDTPSGSRGVGGATPVLRPANPSRLALPAGAVQLMVWASGYRPSTSTIDVAPGRDAVQIELQRVYELELELLDDASPVAVDSDWVSGVEVRSSSGGGEIVTRGTRGRSRPARVVSPTNVMGSSHGRTPYIAVDRPGSYRLELPPVPGYRPIEDVNVEVVAHEPLAIELSMQPAD